jgi:hypothetical protein
MFGSIYAIFYKSASGGYEIFAQRKGHMNDMVQKLQICREDMVFHHQVSHAFFLQENVYANPEQPNGPNGPNG